MIKETSLFFFKDCLAAGQSWSNKPMTTGLFNHRPVLIKEAYVQWLSQFWRHCVPWTTWVNVSVFENFEVWNMLIGRITTMPWWRPLSLILPSYWDWWRRWLILMRLMWVVLAYSIWNVFWSISGLDKMFNVATGIKCLVSSLKWTSPRITAIPLVDDVSGFTRPTS